MGRAVNTLLPVASIGGEIVKARVLVLWGIDGKHSSASAVVDKTVQALMTIVWGIIGISLLAAMSLDDELALYSALGLAILAAGIAGFWVVQKAGVFGLLVKSAKLVTSSERIESLVGTADEVDGAVRALYRDRGRVLRAGTWRLSALLLQTGEVWLAAYLLGFPIGILEAVMLKSLSSTSATRPHDSEQLRHTRRRLHRTRCACRPGTDQPLPSLLLFEFEKSSSTCRV